MFDGLLRLKGRRRNRQPIKFIAGTLGLVLSIVLVVFISSYVNLMKTNYWRGKPNPWSLIAHDAAFMLRQSASTLSDNQPIPVESTLPSLRLRVQPGSLEQMVSDLPSSARRQYYPATMQYPDGQYRRIQYRLRGRNYWHWDLTKPSLRIKLRKQAPLDLQRRINLVNPEDRAMVSNILSEAVGTNMGVLTHQTEFTRLFLNEQYLGVYHLTTQDDESWLRLKKRFPGPIYIGEALERTWTADRFRKAGDLDALQYVQPMEQLIAAMDVPQGIDQLSQLWSVLSKPAYANWLAAMAITGSVHADYSHNQLFYFDPTAGLLEPAMTDVNGYDFVPRLNEPNWSAMPDIPLNGMTYPLNNVALRDPHLRHLRNVAIFEAINSVASVETQHSQLDVYSRLIDKDALADHRKGALWIAKAGFNRFPYNNKEYRVAQRSVRDWIVQRNAFLDTQLRATSVTVHRETKSEGRQSRMLIEVAGHSAVRFDIASTGARLAYDRNGDGTPATPSPAHMILHPGLTLNPDDIHPRMDERALTPHHVFDPGSERFLFSIEADGADFMTRLTAAFTNAVTGEKVTPTIQGGKFAKDGFERNGVSVHPWLFDEQSTGNVRLGPGVVDIHKNLHVGPKQQLHVEPGTTLRLAADVSILSKGRVLLAGTSERPIVIERLDPEQAWGAIVVHGKDSSGSRITHANIAGGSWVTAFNVRYSGMVSAHWSNDFSIESTSIGANILSDDTLHIVSGNFTLKQLRLDNCYADCIDLDYAKGKISGLRIANSGNDGLDLMSSEVMLENSQIVSSRDKAISIGEASKLRGNGLTISKSVIGIAVKDRSEVDIQWSSLNENEVAVDIFKKNWRFGQPGSIKIAATVLKDNQVNARVEDGGTLAIVGTTRPDRITGDGTIKLISPEAGS